MTTNAPALRPKGRLLPVVARSGSNCAVKRAQAGEVTFTETTKPKKAKSARKGGYSVMS